MNREGTGNGINGQLWLQMKEVTRARQTVKQKDTEWMRENCKVPGWIHERPCRIMVCSFRNQAAWVQGPAVPSFSPVTPGK